MSFPRSLCYFSVLGPVPLSLAVPSLTPVCLSSARQLVSVRERLRSELYETALNRRACREVSGQEEKDSGDERPVQPPRRGASREDTVRLARWRGCAREVPAINGLDCLNLFLFSLPPSLCLRPLCLNNRSHLSRDVRGPSTPLGLQTKSQCLSVEQSTIFMLSQTSSSLSF